MLGASGTALAFSLAGCTGAGDDSETGTDSEVVTDTMEPDTETATPESAATETGESSQSPLSVPEDAHCAVCNMMPAKFPDYNAQLQFESAEPLFFCSNGCMASFAADSGHFDEAYADASIAAAFVHDHDSVDWIDGLEASYALEMNSERVNDPMRINPLAFDTETDATAYVEQYDDLTAEDIVSFEAFDRDLAKQYRGSFFE